MTITALAKVLRDPHASAGKPRGRPLHHRQYSVRAAARERAAKIADSVIAQVCDAANVERDALLSQDRHRELAEARQIAAWLMRQEDVSYPLIAKNLNRLDHTTVLHAVDKVDHSKELLRIAQGIRRGECVHDLCMQRWHPAELERQRRMAAKPPTLGDRGADLIAAGTHSHVGAALEVGCHHQTIRNACMKRGLPTTTEIARREAREKLSFAMIGRRREPTAEAIRRQTRALEMHEAGNTYAEVAEAIGGTVGTVAGLIRRARLHRKYARRK